MNTQTHIDAAIRNLRIREVGHVLANLVSRSNNYAPRSIFSHSTLITNHTSVLYKEFSYSQFHMIQLL